MTETSYKRGIGPSRTLSLILIGVFKVDVESVIRSLGLQFYQNG